ncbi:MAG: DUF3479 domain-containing protein, partial [Acidobacteriota bacterium]|nr:DUF3479 domain-containing protein [Acidobacteriota bacterium]
MKVTALFVGSSLLGPLRSAEGEINRAHGVGLRVAAHNFGAPLDEGAWAAVESDLAASDVVFVIHVTDGENAARLIRLLDGDQDEAGSRAVVVINCMPELMRRTRMGKLSFGGREPKEEGGEAKGRLRSLVRTAGAWMGEQARARRKGAGHGQYLKLVERMPALLRFVPSAGRLRDLKHYLYLFCYFLQPTPANVASMLLYALKHYGGDPRLSGAKVPPPESVPAVGVYHPEAANIFESFGAYRRWYDARARRSGAQTLEPSKTIGLLLMRTNVVSGTRRHYDELVRAV